MNVHYGMPTYMWNESGAFFDALLSAPWFYFVSFSLSLSLSLSLSGLVLPLLFLIAVGARRLCVYI